MAAVQTRCDRCRSPLAGGASYCDRCGQRTRRAQGMVRLVLRVELLALLLMAAMVGAFVWVFMAQGTTR